MSEDFKYVVLPKVSIRPSKIVFYNQVMKNYNDNSVTKEKILKEVKEELHCWGIGKKRVVENNAHKFEISKKAADRIKEKVTWLYELARNKTVKTTGGKILFSFKMNFITLTLPAKQFHTTDEITKICLNQFFTECKKKFGLENYVWRLEFQKNGNAHYHIATDSYIDYVNCKLIWNRCIQKLNYVSEYQKKFSKMSFEQYRTEYSENGKIPFNILRERYGRGCATRWDSPNTVDVKVVTNAKNISIYISKYITKKSEHKLNSIVSEREPNESNLRLWYCSRSLSKLKSIQFFLEEYNALAMDIIEELKNIKKFVYDYVTVWYFNTKEQLNKTKANLWLLYRQYASDVGYKPSN